VKCKSVGWIAVWTAVMACMVVPAASPSAAPQATSTGKAAPSATQIPPAETAALVDVMVFFTVSDPLTMHLQAATRQIPSSRFEAGMLSDALEELLKGPTEAERAQGLTSWFSGETADALKGVAVGMAGDVAVDFAGLSGRIPNASTSAGSLMLLSQLNATVFQFPFVNQVEYTLDGSCQAFWEWLQYECHPVTRAEWEAEPTP
jgi:hypothetical protein